MAVWNHLGWVGLTACGAAACSTHADGDGVSRRETHGGVDGAASSNAGGTASSNGSGGASPEPPLPDARAPRPTEGCDGLLAVVRTAGQARCVSNAQCAQALREPDRVLQWALFIDEYTTDAAGSSLPVSDAELEHRAGCVAGWLERQGLSNIRVENDFNIVWFVGTWGNASAVVTFQTVQGFQIGCTEEGCAYCDDLPHDACTEDAFCVPVSGTRADVATGCWTSAPAGCRPLGGGCSEGSSYALDGDGACWSFGACAPNRFTRVSPPFAPDSPCSATEVCPPAP